MSEALSPGEITVLLDQWSNGSGQALDQMIPLVYDALRQLSHRIMRRETRLDATATGLVHQLYMRLIGYSGVKLQDRAHFMAFCARLMRQLLTDEARAMLSLKRGEGPQKVVLSEELAWIGERDTDLLDLDLAIEELRRQDGEKARLTELRLYLGCSAGECAEILGVSKSTVDRSWAFARAWLYSRIRPGPVPRSNSSELGQ